MSNEYGFKRFYRILSLSLIVMLSGCSDKLSDVSKAAEQGDAKAQHDLGSMYADGLGVE